MDSFFKNDLFVLNYLLGGITFVSQYRLFL